MQFLRRRIFRLYPIGPGLPRRSYALFVFTLSALLVVTFFLAGAPALDTHRRHARSLFPAFDNAPPSSVGISSGGVHRAASTLDPESGRDAIDVRVVIDTLVDVKATAMAVGPVATEEANETIPLAGRREKKHKMHWKKDKVDITLRKISDLKSILEKNFPVTFWTAARQITLDSLDHLTQCLREHSCSERELDIVIGGSFHFGNSQYGHVSGEDIWARSSVDAFNEIGVTLLYAYDMLEIKAIHDTFGDQIKAILSESTTVDQCAKWGIPSKLSQKEAASDDYIKMTLKQAQQYRSFNGYPELKLADEKEGEAAPYGWKRASVEETEIQNGIGCAKRKGFPDGIPIWKFYSFHFWDSPAHTLGAPWTMSPEPYGQHSWRSNQHEANFHLGYSVEKYCSKYRPSGIMGQKENRAFVLAKNPNYFKEDAFVFFNENRTFQDLHADLNMDFVTGAGNKGDILPDKGITNLGRMPIQEFYSELGKSAVLLGIGQPYLSPTPYDALCLGVPFINPIFQWDQNKPQDRTQWRSQHNSLLALAPPFVYNVFKGDLVGLRDALKHARSHPIPPYIPPWMTSASNRERHTELISNIDAKKDKAQTVIDGMKDDRIRSLGLLV